MSAKIENLKPVQSTAEARERGRRGGIASGEARRKKRDLRFALLALMETTDDTGSTGTERLAAALFKKALEGDVKAIAMVQELTEQAVRMEESELFGLVELADILQAKPTQS